MHAIAYLLLLLLNYAVCFGEDYECGANYDEFDKNVISNLRGNGYIVDEGYLRWYSNQSGYAANPSLFYGLFVFNRTKPYIPHKKYMEDLNELEDVNDFGRIRPHMNYDEFWYMYGTEAIIWYGCHAPAQYYSYRSYQNRRINPKHPFNNDTQINNEKYPETDSYGSLGDMLNNYNINSTKNGLQLMISTPDNKTYTDIQQLSMKYLSNLNLTDINQINLDIMPYDNISIDGPGFGAKNKKKTQIYYLKYPDNDDMNGAMRQILERETLDGIGIMVRFGLPFNDSYNNYISTKQKVYKIYYPYNKTINRDNWDKPREAFKKPFIHNLSTGIYEQDTLEPYFTKYSNIIYKYFNVQYKNKYLWRYMNTKISVPFYQGNHQYGFNCIKYGTRCMADNRDAQYFLTWPDVSELTNTSIFLFMGVIHKDMNKCQWENIVPYFANSGLHSRFYRNHYLVYLSEGYRNSAMQFPPNINDTNNKIPPNVLNKFFIVAAMRPEMCSRYFDNNLQFPELKNIPKFCFDNNDFPYNTTKQNWFMVHRCYINPSTQTRPDANEMIPFISMKFETQWFEFNTA